MSCPMRWCLLGVVVVVVVLVDRVGATKNRAKVPMIAALYASSIFS